MPENLTIECKDCGHDFTIEPAEKKWYEDHEMTLPKRCKTCRALKKAKFGGK